MDVYQFELVARMSRIPFDTPCQELPPIKFLYPKLDQPTPDLGRNQRADSSDSDSSSDENSPKKKKGGCPCNPNGGPNGCACRSSGCSCACNPKGGTNGSSGGGDNGSNKSKSVGLEKKKRMLQRITAERKRCEEERAKRRNVQKLVHISLENGDNIRGEESVEIKRMVHEELQRLQGCTPRCPCKTDCQCNSLH